MKRPSRALKNGDPTAEAELHARSIAARLQRGLPLTRQQRSWWSDDVAAALLKFGGLLALATHHKILNRALSDDRLSAMALGQKSADGILDRLLGRPTEKLQVRTHQTIVFQGLDPSLLPDGPAKAGSRELAWEGMKPKDPLAPKRRPVRSRKHPLPVADSRREIPVGLTPSGVLPNGRLVLEDDLDLALVGE